MWWRMWGRNKHLHPNMLLKNHNFQNNGGPRRIRTPDPLIRSQVLYPAELSVHEGRSKTYSDALQGLNTRFSKKYSGTLCECFGQGYLKRGSINI